MYIITNLGASNGCKVSKNRQLQETQKKKTRAPAYRNAERPRQLKRALRAALLTRRTTVKETEERARRHLLPGSKMIRKLRPSILSLLLLFLQLVPLSSASLKNELSNAEDTKEALQWNITWCRTSLPSFQYKAECGTRPLMDESTVGSRIIGGHDAELGAWPWQVSLQIHYSDGAYRHICAGALINNNSVLTAAHCIKNYVNPNMWKAVVGLHHLYKHLPYTTVYHVKYIIIHSDFEFGTFENDVALFRLTQLVKYNGYVQPICLPDAAHFQINKHKNPCYISGWGSTKEKGKGKHILQEAQVDIIPLQICNSYDWYAGTVSLNMICAGSESGHVDSCQGDSGGPLVCYFPDANKYYLIGITSSGFGCGRPKFPGLYVRTASYRNWIYSYISNKTNTAFLET
ncbi:transmembrane protease serine 12-like [Python bivittatus]|uniref:Transmembrane protease serine 12-like n=1 Tax=Python bivittatus TaxID=176946 RepID=A0A9F5MYA9_PYTBI|nr:transmembrane protease serine 12-like [Python bivittatus]